MSADPTAAVGRVPAARRSTNGTSPQTLSGYLRLWWQGVRAGDLGTLPIIIGLVLIFLTFGLLEENFLTERNFTNLLLQMSAIRDVAIGVVFVLLIGEIDLSVAFVSAVGAVVMTLLLRPDDPGWPWWAAIAVALLCTTAIGLLHAIVITKAGVPSFVVTLAGFLIWSGVVLILTTQYSTAGTIRIQDETVVGIANDFLSELWGWILAVVVVVAYAVDPAPHRARAPGSQPGGEADVADRAPDARPRGGDLRGRLVPERGPRRAAGHPHPRDPARCSGRSSPAARASAGTSTRSAAARRRRDGPESTSTACGSPSS